MHARTDALARLVGRALTASAVFLLLGNIAILGMFVGARLTAGDEWPQLPGIHHLRLVDDRLWRGDAPSRAGYQALARSGVTTIIDLRAENDIDVDVQALERLGLTRVHLPIRDGQTPTSTQVDRFFEIVAQSDGVVYVHCGAGVGRTGTLAAAYLMQEHERSPWNALHHNLSVGPPSVEQLAFVASALGDGEPNQPGPVLTVVSRVLDAPRRLFTSARHGL